MSYQSGKARASGRATPGARARQAEKERQHAAALKAWNPSDKPDWLAKEVYREKIQPRLTRVTVAAIASALGVSQPYAALIRAGHLPLAIGLQLVEEGVQVVPPPAT